MCGVLLSRLPRLPLRKERRLLTYVSKTIDRTTCMCPTQCSELEWAGEGGTRMMLNRLIPVEN